ncbi:MAG: MFS transporter [Planctomycetota bacterium]|nr:MFS transporter [Planctomycetota bacterium]
MSHTNNDVDVPSASLRAQSLDAAYRQALFWAVMFGGGETSFTLFATFIQAEPFMFGLLAGIPSLLGPSAQAAAAWMLDRTGRRKSLVLKAVLVQALCFLPMAALPFLAPGPLVMAIFLFSITIYFACAHLAHPPWYSMIGDLVPDSERGNYFAKLSRMPSLVALVTQLSLGGALYLASFHQAGAWVFLGAFAAAGVSRLISYFIVRGMREPVYRSTPADSFTFWQFIRRTPESNFARFSIYAGLFYFGANVAGPYFVPYVTYDLGYKIYDWQLLTASSTLASILTMLAWGRFSDRFGTKRTIIITSFLICVIPVLWLLTTRFWLLLAINMMGASFWTGFSICCYNYILEAASPGKRARCVAYFNIIIGMGVFLGSVAGERLYHWLPEATFIPGVHSSFPYVLAISGGVRLLMCLIFLPMFRELRTVQDFSLSKWFVTITQMRSMYGLRLSVFVERPPEPEETEQKKSAEADGQPDPKA